MSDVEVVIGLSEANAESVNWNIQDKYKGLSLSEIRYFQPKLPYSICMLNTRGSLNIGVALRSAVLFGASKFYIVGRRRYDKRSTVGADSYIDVERMNAIDDNGKYDTIKIFDKIVTDGYDPVMIETGGIPLNSYMDYYSSNKNKPCFFFGEEKDGIPSEFLFHGYSKVSIPTYGVLRSLNVSVAASIVMHEISKIARKKI